MVNKKLDFFLKILDSFASVVMELPNICVGEIQDNYFARILRSTKMIRMKHALEFPLLLTCLLALAACSDGKEETDGAIMEAKAELEKVEAILHTTQSERDQLVEDLAQVAGERDRAESELAAITSSFQILQSQVAQLTSQRDEALAQARTAQATVESLTTQLRKKEKELREYQQWGDELLVTIKALEEQLEQTSQQVPEETYEESGEQPTEEMPEESGEEAGAEESG
jgi:chromosome segregation ATPase